MTAPEPARALPEVLRDALHAGMVESQITEAEHEAALAWLDASQPTVEHRQVQVCGECGHPWPCPAVRPMVRCANERCGEDFNDRRPHAIYCSPRCAKAQVERERRRRLKQEQP